MDLKEKMELLETIMELEEGELNLEMELDGLEEWDSLSKLSLMAEVRKRMGKTISVDEIKGFVTVQDICDYLE
mgnify:CR=1 FL=1